MQMPLDGVLSANHRNTSPGLPLQEFAPATTEMPYPNRQRIEISLSVPEFLWDYFQFLGIVLAYK
ncbi:MAG TPA: hypothetical protein VLA46_05540 [Saprospiraceae bacterium]|nr:hypothetical protein [Saprospiraceae bacterium]